MRLPQRLQLNPDRRRRLVAVARGTEDADVVVRTPRLLNVYTGEVEERAEVGVAEGRIAWVGPWSDRRAAQEVAIEDGVVVPGLIEPHCHPDLLYTPDALAAAVAVSGTTTVCADTMTLSLGLDDRHFRSVLDDMAAASTKFLWNLRACIDAVAPIEHARWPEERLVRLARTLPDVVSSGEMTAWRQLLEGDHRLNSLVDEIISLGLRVDGHAAGASARTLGAIAAAGVTADHESITADEVQERIRLGLWVMLRHSSLRPDGAVLAEIVKTLGTSRLMLTTDGPVAADVLEGYVDAAVREVMRGGVSPVDAVRMATVNPATYLGLDAHIGGVAPGRCADLLVVDSLGDFRPQFTMCEGALIDGTSVRSGFSGWQGLPSRPFLPADIDAQTIERLCIDGPALRLEGVITRSDSPSTRLRDDASYCVLIARDASWAVAGTIRGVRVPALATSFTGAYEVLLIGHDATAMIAAYRRIVALGGALVTPHHEVPLRALGSLYVGPLRDLAAAVRRVEDELNLPPGLPPLEYLLLFLTIGVLPDVRLTPVGALAVKTGQVLQPPAALRPVAAGEGEF